LNEGCHFTRIRDAVDFSFDNPHRSRSEIGGVKRFARSAGRNLSLAAEGEEAAAGLGNGDGLDGELGNAETYDRWSACEGEGSGDTLDGDLKLLVRIDRRKVYFGESDCLVELDNPCFVPVERTGFETDSESCLIGCITVTGMIDADGAVTR
jgi:hypothetical protein